MTSNAKACKDEPYPSIGDYGFISDCHSSALVSHVAAIMAIARMEKAL
jgi:hypothetical protein